MKSNRSRVLRPRHVLGKFTPTSGGASFRPARSGEWQLAQLAWYTVRPAIACAAVNPAPAGCCPDVAATAPTSAAPTTAALATLIGGSPAAAAIPTGFRPAPSRSAAARRDVVCRDRRVAPV